MLITLLKLKILLAVLFFQTITADWKDGKCDDVSIVKNFVPIRFKGLWYINQRSHGIDDQRTCEQIAFHNSGYSFWPATKYYVNDGEKKVVGLVFEAGRSYASGTTPSEDNYYIVATDYNNYAVFYICPEDVNPAEENYFILTREKHPDESYIEDAKKAIEDNGADTSGFFKTEQDDCPSQEDWDKIYKYNV